MSPIVHEYFKLTKNFRNSYGRNTIIFIQDGNKYKVFANNLNELQIMICRNILQISVKKQDHALFFSEFNYDMYTYYEKNILVFARRQHSYGRPNVFLRRPKTFVLKCEGRN